MTSTRPILLVDDDPMAVELTLLAFERNKSVRPVLVANDGDEALAWIGRWAAGEPKPALILLDVSMPKVSGLEVVRQIKADPALRSIPVVMLTTSGIGRDIDTAYRNGANSYIVKQMDFDRFSKELAQIEAYWTGLNVLPD